MKTAEPYDDDDDDDDEQFHANERHMRRDANREMYRGGGRYGRY